MPGQTSPNSQAVADGYYRSSPQKYSYLRADLTMLIRYAACEVAARYPNTAPLALGDLSQADGLTPGTDINNPRHPTTTHTGNDADVSYYQTDGANNYQIICGDGSDNNNNGVTGQYNDGYFCTTQQNIVDWERELWWFSRMAESPLVRVTGVDETLADGFAAGADALYAAGDISAPNRDRMKALGYGNAGGWAFHHHHSHHSFYLASSPPPPPMSSLPSPSSGFDCRLHMECPQVY